MADMTKDEAARRERERHHLAREQHCAKALCRSRGVNPDALRVRDDEQVREWQLHLREVRAVLGAADMYAASHLPPRREGRS